jgi:gliding motility-associated-like protein
MKKNIKSFVCLFLITALSNASVFAKTYVNNSEDKILATAPPTVISPIYLCQNSVATPLTATSSGGGTLNWYLTNTPTEIASSVAPTPSTTTVGSTTYYVTETILGVESSPRTPIVVNVVADTGGALTLFCDAANTTPTSVAFDWNNVTGYLGYNFSYSVAGGPLVYGFQVAPSHFDVPVPGPGTTVTFTILSVSGLPCVKPITVTCNSTCSAAQNITPTFTPIPSFCTGTPAPSLPTTSIEGISGTWSPATISNTASGNYVFTPDPILFPCASTQTLPVTVTPLISPTFTAIPAIVCQGASAPILPLISSNATPITGTWNPPTVDTSTLGTVVYTFTPNVGQCTSATLTTTTINIVPNVTSNFAAIPPLCSGSPAPILATTSPNGITGTWSPAIINNTIDGNYVFTPNPNQCASSQTLNVVITPRTIPDFANIQPFCSGTVAPTLATTSPNGISGTWSPAVISNTASGSYLFTPNATECATTQTLNVVVDPLITPDFDDLILCSGTTAPLLEATSPNGINGTWLPSSIDNMTSGTYVFTPDATECATTKTINVTINPSNTLVSITWTVTEAFSNNQIVTVDAAAAGNYLYQMDFGPFQTSPVFENVASGIHSITVKEVNGCSAPITDANVLVIGYPKYFTPNGDAYNDTWNISGLSDLSNNSRIYIFDRYGKLLKDISPNDNGWDGTYTGQPMPATDYWFSVEYEEQGIIKKFKSHFSLKR